MLIKIKISVILWKITWNVESISLTNPNDNFVIVTLELENLNDIVSDEFGWLYWSKLRCYIKNQHPCPLIKDYYYY